MIGALQMKYLTTRQFKNAPSRPLAAARCAANLFARLVFVLSVAVAVPAWALGDAPTFAAKEPVKNQTKSLTQAERIAGVGIDRYATMPVEFAVEGIKYKIPRNYISTRAIAPIGGLIRFAVTYPGFRPFEKGTEDCLKYEGNSVQEGCVQVAFSMNADENGVPGKQNGVKLSSHTDENGWFEKMKKNIPKLAREGEEYGFSRYAVHHTNGRLDEFFVSKTDNHLLIISCFQLYHDRPQDETVCDNRNSEFDHVRPVFYRINYTNLQYAKAIDNGIFNLLNSFAIRGDAK